MSIYHVLTSFNLRSTPINQSINLSIGQLADRNIPLYKIVSMRKEMKTK